MDSDLLRYKILTSRMPIKSLISQLGISQSTWYKKINNKTELTRDEIQKLVKLLNLTESDIIDIFLIEKCLLRYRIGGVNVLG